MHAPSPQPCMPPGQPHTPRQPCMPPATTHHTHPPATMHAAPQATTHAPWQPCTPPLHPHMPPSNHTPPGNHACPPSNHTCPPVNRMTNRCENITLPQTSFAGGNYTKDISLSKSSTCQLTYLCNYFTTFTEEAMK